MKRHFTVTGFVIDGDATLLHWHRKLGIWLPPGGHVDPDEDPVQAVLREVLEETGIVAEIVPHRAPFAYSNVAQLPPPISMIVADAVEDGVTHQHIDMCYALRPVAGTPQQAPDEDHGFVRVTETELRRNDALPVAVCGVDVAVPEDVREIALAAFDLVRGASLEPSP
jgi:8-oxo-dGTP pyrophosphatase MutT (NUDIX family)